MFQIVECCISNDSLSDKKGESVQEQTVKSSIFTLFIPDS